MLPKAEADVRLGDCLSIMKAMGDASVDLVYVDPPFFTQRTHRLRPRDRSREFSFQDVWSSWDEYAEFLAVRLREAHRVLSRRGSLFLHCDRNAVHLGRVLLDGLFGPNNFRAEIIWHYRRWSNSSRGLLPAHQTILYYTKTDDYTFNQLWTEYSPSTNVDQLLQRRCRDDSDKAVYKRDDRGNVVVNGDKSGVPLSDVWDIPFLNPKAKERVGYPTQKPLLLLERIISLATNEGDCVLDPFCGSGTTLVAALSMGRRAIGIDISRDAVDLTEARLRFPVKTESRVLSVGRESYRSADASALAFLEGLDYLPVHRNEGIDALLKEGLQGGPVPIRVQRPWETVLEAAEKLYGASVKKGARIMFLVTVSRGGCFEFAASLPPGVVAVEAPVLAIRDHLAGYQLLGAGSDERARELCP